jgi:hypothetical protein
MGTKNNPKNRAKVEKKKFNGKDVEPVYFYGVHNNTGKFMAAKYAGTTQLVTDEANRIMQWEELNS